MTEHQELLITQLRKLGDDLSVERHTVRMAALDAADEIEELHTANINLIALLAQTTGVIPTVSLYDVITIAEGCGANAFKSDMGNVVTMGETKLRNYTAVIVQDCIKLARAEQDRFSSLDEDAHASCMGHFALVISDHFKLED